MKHIKDLKIVITAGASGIGSDIAQILSQADAKVIICDKDQEALDQFSKNNPEIKTLTSNSINKNRAIQPPPITPPPTTANCIFLSDEIMYD